jgi:hypothetical protein
LPKQERTGSHCDRSEGTTRDGGGVYRRRARAERRTGKPLARPPGLCGPTGGNVRSAAIKGPDNVTPLPTCRAWRQRSTSSAWKRSVGGRVRPKAWAVVRVLTSSKVMGCSTGRSAGWAPFRILATETAARRFMSAPRRP